jgi:archaellum component FlaG (FlaF/FlaG flagellin family)
MRRKLLVLGICALMLISVFISGCTDTSENEDSQNEEEPDEVEEEYIQVSTDKEVYQPGENVTIYLKNISNSTLNQTDGWEDYKIISSEGNIAFHQMLVTGALTSILPGEKVTVGIWDQKDTNGTQIVPGVYVVEKEYAGYNDTTEFQLIEQNQSLIQVSTDKEVYHQGENITIYLKNIGSVTLNQTSGWEDYKIISSEGNIAFHQMIVTLLMTSILPGEKVTVRIWDQKDTNGTQIVPGTYIVEKGYAGYIDTVEFQLIEQNQSLIQVSTDNNDYQQGENITIYLKNIGSVTLNETHGWEDYKIKNNNGDIVFHQMDVSAELTSLLPGEKVTVGIWDQKDINGTQMAPGIYVVEKEYAGYIDTEEFNIQ